MITESRQSKTERPRKIRIAIIDGGVSKGDSVLKRATKKESIKGWWNFCSDDHNDCEDNVRHGTMVARLLTRLP